MPTDTPGVVMVNDGVNLSLPKTGEDNLFFVLWDNITKLFVSYDLIAFIRVMMEVFNILTGLLQPPRPPASTDFVFFCVPTL